jgi:hypothetical protein
MCGPPCAPMLSSLFSGGAPKNVQLARSSRTVFNHRSALVRGGRLAAVEAAELVSLCTR